MQEICVVPLILALFTGCTFWYTMVFKVSQGVPNKGFCFNFNWYVYLYDEGMRYVFNFSII